MRALLFVIAINASASILSAVAFCDHPSGSGADDRAVQRREGEDSLMELFIDSDNNNDTDLPDFSAWEAELRSHEFAIGKVIKVGSKNRVPLVIRFKNDVSQSDRSAENDLQDNAISFGFAEPVGKIAIFKTRSNGQSLDAQPAFGQLDFWRPYKLRDLNFNAAMSQVVVWIEALEAVPHLVTKDDIDRRGRPDLFLSVKYYPYDFFKAPHRSTQPGSTQVRRDETVADSVKILPVEPNSFFTEYVIRENRHIRDAIAAGLVNGRQWFDGNMHPVMPHESKAYGWQLVTQDELFAILGTRARGRWPASSFWCYQFRA